MLSPKTQKRIEALTLWAKTRKMEAESLLMNLNENMEKDDESAFDDRILIRLADLTEQGNDTMTRIFQKCITDPERVIDFLQPIYEKHLAKLKGELQ